VKVIQWVSKSGSRNIHMGSPATLHIQAVKGSRDLLFEFWDPLYISGNSWSMHIHHPGTNQRNAKSGQRRPRRGHVTYLWSCGTFSISQEQLEIEISNLVGRLTTTNTNERNVKLGQKAREGITWPPYLNCGTPPYVGNGWDRNFKFGVHIHH